MSCDYQIKPIQSVIFKSPSVDDVYFKIFTEFALYDFEESCHATALIHLTKLESIASTHGIVYSRINTYANSCLKPLSNE